MCKIYFAHPKFNEAQKAFAEGFLTQLTRLDDALTILDPFEYSPNIEGDRELVKKLAKTVLDANHRLIQASDLIIAVIDGRDIGVIYEVGYAVALGIPVITISAHDYDVNIMLSASVMAHFPNIMEDKQLNQLLEVLASQAALVSLNG